MWKQGDRPPEHAARRLHKLRAEAGSRHLGAAPAGWLGALLIQLWKPFSQTWGAYGSAYAYPPPTLRPRRLCRPSDCRLPPGDPRVQPCTLGSGALPFLATPLTRPPLAMLRSRCSPVALHPYTCLHPCERHTGGDPWRPWGDATTKSPQKEAWVPQDPTHLSDQLEGLTLSGHCWWMGHSRGPLPSPHGPRVPALQPGLQHSSAQGLGPAWTRHVRSAAVPAPTLGGRLDQGHPAHPGTCPSSTQLLAGETHCLCERSPDSWSLMTMVDLGPGRGPRRACFLAHLYPVPTMQSHSTGSCCSISVSADSITGTGGLRPWSS